MGTLNVSAQATIGGMTVYVSANGTYSTQTAAQTAFTAMKNALLVADPAAIVSATYNSGSTLT